MNNERIEELLERIAVALEKLAGSSDARSNTNAGKAVKTGLKDPGVRTNTASFTTPPPAPALELFLASKGIQIKAIPPADPADHIIDSLSLFLGERYNALSRLLTKIKRAMQSGSEIEVSLRNRTQQDVSSNCQFCARLREIAFLEQYRYSPSPTYLIRAKTTTLPRAQRFFGGQWLERYILQKVKAVHQQVVAEGNCERDFECLINPQIILPNGDDFELDVLARFGPSVYWIEAKSGDYQQHVAKYSKFARVLGLDCAHSLMVLTDVPDDRCEALSSLFSMTVCNLWSFEEKLLAVARSDSARQRFVTDDL